MLGWSGGGAGTAVYLEDDFELGMMAPQERPRPAKAQQSFTPAAEGLFGKYRKIFMGNNLRENIIFP